MHQSSKFRPELLPAPRPFYERELGKLRPAGRDKAVAFCPFHPDRRHPNLYVQLVSPGKFYCFACNTGGGDVLEFVRLRYHLTFKEAAIQLGAWDDRNFSFNERMQLACQRSACLRAEMKRDAQLEIQRRERIEARDWLHRLERVYAQANHRLTQLRQGEAPAYEGEEELLWTMLADSLDLVRIAAARYAEVAGVTLNE